MLSPLKDLVDLSDKLGIIQVVKSKLINQPDPAADHLFAALEEISKIYLALEIELTRYLSLTLEPDQKAEERKALIELEGGQITARMSAARGHCSKIFNIYQRYLTPWFQRVLAPEEQSMMQKLFSDLSVADRGMIDIISKVSMWLEARATETLNLIDADNFQSAKQRVRKAREEVAPARKAISTAMRRIRELEADFIEISGAVA